MIFQAYRQLLHYDARIWLAVTLYGLAAGIVSYVATLSYEDRNIDGLALIMNFPTFFVMFSISSGSLSIPESISTLVIIGSSTAVWSFIGLIVYAFVKMFRLGP